MDVSGLKITVGDLVRLDKIEPEGEATRVTFSILWKDSGKIGEILESAGPAMSSAFKDGVLTLEELLTIGVAMATGKQTSSGDLLKE